MWWKVLIVLFIGLIIYSLVRLFRATIRFKHSLDEISVKICRRLLRFSSEVESTPERWHEYDEAYKQAAASLEDDSGLVSQPPSTSRGATLGPKGGSFRKTE